MAPGHPTHAVKADKYYEDLSVGDSRSMKDARTITESDIVNFANLTGDTYPLHVSREFAESSRFGERIAHGNLVFVITEGIIAETNEQWVASLGHNVRYHEPVFIGDTLSAKREIIEKSVHDEESGRVVYEYTTTNQHDETVCTNEHTLLINRRAN